MSRPYISKEMRRLDLSEGERTDLVAFLEALSGDVTPVTVPTDFPR